MTFDASNRKAIRLLEKDAEVRAQSRVNFLCAAMTTEQGRLFFHDLLADCGIGTVAPVFEPNKDYYLLGRQSVGLGIRAQIETHCPDQYIQMMRDEHVRTAAATERLRRADPGRDTPGREGSDPDPEPDLFADPGPDPYEPDAQ